MYFKNPEILYFLFLLLIPILVHLFQLRRFKKEYFSNVRFLKELSIQTRKSSKLKKYLLLLTRIFLLAFLIFAFAQPYFEGKNKNFASNELFIILDNSNSMEAKGANGPLLKKAITELIQSVPESKNFSLITNDQTYYNVDIKSIQKEIQNIDYSATSFNLENSLNKIKSINNHPKDVILITDGIDLTKNDLEKIEKNDLLNLVQLKAQQKNNVSIDSVYLNQISESFNEITIVLKFFGKYSNQLPIALYNNNKLVAKTLVKPVGTNQNITLTIPSENFNGYVKIDDGSLSYDNYFYFDIEKPKKIKVLSIGEAKKADFLKKIYTEKEFDYLNNEIRTINFNEIQNQDVIVLNEIQDVSESLQTTLKNFVGNGGNLIIIPHQEYSVSYFNQIVSLFGNIVVNNTTQQEHLITKIAFDHPVFRNVFDQKIDNFQYPNVKFTFEISGKINAILSYQNSKHFASSIQNKHQSVFVFAAPINLENSNFQKSPLIVPTFYNMAQNVNNLGINSYKIGDQTTIVKDLKLETDEIIHVRNSDVSITENFIPQQMIQNQKIQLTFVENPHKAGNLQLYTKNETLDHLSFNYPRSESNLFLNNEVEKFSQLNSIDQALDQLLTDRKDQEIWKIFLLLTLILIATEILIQKFVK